MTSLNPKAPPPIIILLGLELQCMSLAGDTNNQFITWCFNILMFYSALIFVLILVFKNIAVRYGLS